MGMAMQVLDLQPHHFNQGADPILGFPGLDNFGLAQRFADDVQRGSSDRKGSWKIMDMCRR